ncbi:class I SAM-dependent methyltransferase [Uliginosibacterium flavum]|uniref:Class I SAM-dependent methyltransferase n=1 Tax=Uliginosibacterium flavum TaxID=1396831 RepID=A0ABV2TLS0_9RHOO
MWDERYANAEYVYGTEPNSFLVEHAHRLSGPVLSLAEGEGRNAVFLASMGLKVLGVDSSAVGLRKAHALASARQLKIETEVADLAHFTPTQAHYGAVVSIFAHLPGALRQRLYPLIEQSLVPGGFVLLEAYSEEQLAYTTGGPKDDDMLMSVAKIEQHFPELEPVLLRQIEREVCEGSYHTGRASVVQFIGRKS